MSTIHTPGRAVNVTPRYSTALPLSGMKPPPPPGANAGKAPGAQTQLPTPPAPPAPAQPGGPPGTQTPVPKPGPFGGGKVPGMQELGQMLQGVTNPGYDQIAKMTSQRPPLSMYTPRLGSMQGPADTVLGGIQTAVKDNPGRFAGLIGGLAPGLTSGVLSAGPVGLAGLLGLNGLLGGGESFAAANQFFKPVLPKLGLG